MKFVKNLILLQIFFNSLAVITAQRCVEFKPVTKTRIEWNNGQRLISKKNFFGNIKYKYEPYVFSSVQNFHDYERLTVCCGGYIKGDDDECKPVCKPSCPSNTNCVRPDICECDYGYTGLTTSAANIHCEPICKPECLPNAECIQRDKCVCKKGYGDVDGKGGCQPICTNGCAENAECTKPDICTCSQGYLDNGSGQCQPQCIPECPVFSNCSKPNTCICHDSYRTEDGQCRPICEQECPQHAMCMRPNECECLLGYESVRSADNSSFSCKAKCDVACPTFATCAEPNKCECTPGYSKTEKNLCEPICEGGCTAHSNCTAPNTCSCEKGYVMVQHQCQPVCEKACPDHARCSEPNKCLCAIGYQLKLSSIYNLYCEPVCPNNCSTFGKCVQPNKCECLEGYEMNESELCRPVCSKGCKNGSCFQPDICVCDPGYLMGPREECEPVCSMACQNGSCIEPEICQCLEGYAFLSNSVNVCEPVCETECINGICAAPNVCICGENFEPLQTEGGLNHSNCQNIEKITTEEITVFSSSETSVASNFDLTVGSELLEHSSIKPLVSVHNCNDLCQCWQEYDDFGSLTLQQCAHLCTDGLENPCLDLNLCQCDLGTNQLVCRADEEDDPFYYTCTLARVRATSLQPSGESITNSDMKSAKPTEESQILWWLLVVLGSLIAICLLSLVAYFCCKKPKEPIMEFEL